MTFNKKLLAATLLTVGGFAAMSSANAADSGTMQVSMEVQKSCVVTAGPAIGLVSKSDVAAEIGTSAFKVACSVGTPFSVSMSPTGSTPGTETESKGTLRSLTPGTNTTTLTYQLSTTANGDTPWVAGVAGNATVTGGTGTGTDTAENKDFTVYAKVTQNLNAAIPDTYRDNVTIGVNY